MLITNATQAIIGRVNISQIDAASGSGSLGYRIAENQTGKGVASRAVKYALEVAREHGLQSLNAMVSTTNDASQKVLSRNGFFSLRYGASVDIGRGASHRLYTL